MKESDVNHHPWIIIEGVDYSGKSTLSSGVAKELNGLTIRPIPVEMANLRNVVEQYANLEDRYHFYIASAFYTFRKLEGLLLERSPVIVDRWMFSTNVHHKLLGVPEEALIPDDLIPRSPYMFFTTVSYESWIKRKILRNKNGIDDEYITEDFMENVNKYLKEQGLTEVNTDLLTPQEAVDFVMSHIHNDFSGLRSGSIISLI